jgi:hypothetical protein
MRNQLERAVERHEQLGHGADPDRSLEVGSSAACNGSLALNVDMISRSGRLVGHEWLRSGGCSPHSSPNSK